MSSIAERVTETFANFRIQKREQENRQITSTQIVELFKDDPENYQYLLPNTGFDVSAQVAGFLNSRDDFETKQSRILQDIDHFVREYIDREPVLVNPIQIKDGRVVSIGYGEKEITSYTSKNERNGASFREAEIISKWLPKSPNDTVFISTSPKGPAGVVDFQGNYINHPETQTKIYKKTEDGRLEAYTIRSSMTIDQNISLLQTLSQKNDILDSEYPSDYDLLCDITGTVISRQGISVDEVLSEIQSIRGNVIWKDSDKSIDVEDVRKSLKRAKSRNQTDERIEVIIDDFIKKSSNFSGKLTDRQIKELTIIVGRTVVSVHDELRGKSRNLQQSVSRMSELGGCAGGGIKEYTQGKVFIENGKRYLECFCPVCDKSRTKGKIKALISGGKIHCPRCKTTAAYNC